MTTMPAQSPFRIMIDGECAICRHEGRMLQRLDKGRGLLKMIDITSETFDPADYGITMDDAMGKIHGVTPEGEVITGMEVFRRAYRAIGLGWLWAPTGWPVLRPIFDLFYRWFARNRFWITGRKNPCEGDRCRV
jgi:predicted DCC family thiol-disulfide oxidoreductase YuxK